MLNSTAFNYINVLDRAADVSWTRESLITNNLANVDTPGYKRQDINFESVLRKALGSSKYVPLDTKINEMNMDELAPMVYTDYGNFSYRLDGNNVDIDTENVELASEQIRYEALTTSIDSEFSRIKIAIGQ